MSDSLSFSPQFLAELETLYHQTLGQGPNRPSPTHFDLEWLADRFLNWRKNRQQRLQTVFGRLPPDDPLFCPVSLFGTMDYGRLETAHTRTLAWLLDPRREHGFGDHLLRAVLRKVGGPNSGCQVEKVESEYIISGDESKGRLDVVVWGQTTGPNESLDKWLLVIEGKVDALEGNEQLSRYDAWIDRDEPRRTTYRVFLTPAGRDAETGIGAWQPMSFLQLVCAFRGAMPKICETPGYHFLRYYLAGVLKDVCGWKLPITPDAIDPYGVVEYIEAILGHPQEAANGDAR